MPLTSTPRTPEGRLIRRARKERGLSIPAAAALAGISTQHWGNIERGHQTLSATERLEVTGTADMIALMARTTGVSPAHLETAGRPDAAGELREMGGNRAAGTTAPSAGEEDRAATIAAVQQLYAGDVAAMNAAMFIMTQWHKPLAQRRRELAAVERAATGAAEA
jgi:transcriptional regulator with XRE-family HTH domain